MLQRTFIHLPAIGAVTERRLWQQGILSWVECLRCAAQGQLPRRIQDVALRELEHTVQAWQVSDWAFFEHTLPTRHKWRAYGELAEQALFVDIETTGLGMEDIITVIGTCHGNTVKTFVRGQNLAEAVDEINQYPLLVTFNGAAFDLPLIQRQFPAAARRQLHIDLRYPLKQLGYAGGLKAIEHALAIRRSPETEGLDGWDAVRLWREYQSGNKESLQLLIAYNAEDVRNLKPLVDFAYRQLCRKIQGQDWVGGSNQ